MSTANPESLHAPGALAPPFETLWSIASRDSRLQYAFQHLPAALLWIGVSAIAATLAGRYLLRAAPRRPLSSPVALAIITGIFFAVWLPAWWRGGLVMDDWRLLAAASIRKSVLSHPLLSLQTLDSVDGNFRPLGTVLYFGSMWRWFGAAAHLFTLGPLFFTLLSVLTVYAIVRELGYPRAAAVAGAVLFATRGMLYMVATWSAALGDGIALFLCGLSALLLLKACRNTGGRALAIHLAAWLAFAVATLAKQSAFVMPLIAALLVGLRPGRSAWVARSRRLFEAAAALLIYGATAAAVFFYAGTLSSLPSPYPLGFTADALVHLFAYPTWYLVVLQLPAYVGFINFPAELLGVPLVALCVALAVRYRRAAPGAWRDVVFAVLAAVASISLFLFLQTRDAPYYGCMFSFWLSIAIAIIFARVRQSSLRSARTAALVVLFVAWTGYAEIRLEQTGLVPSGGYVWGSFGPAADASARAAIDRRVAQSPASQTVLFTGCADRITYPAMVLLDAPAVQRILIEDPAAGGFFANVHEGLRPTDDRADLTDPGAYTWTVPLDAGRARQLLAAGAVVKIPCAGGLLSGEAKPK